jgi:hypothetical protein
MKKISFAIGVTTLGLVIFVVMCSLPIAILWLQITHLILTGALIWMVITILKNGTPSPYTFDERFYEDADRGPNHQ